MKPIQVLIAVLLTMFLWTYTGTGRATAQTSVRHGRGTGVRYEKSTLELPDYSDPAIEARMVVLI